MRARWLPLVIYNLVPRVLRFISPVFFLAITRFLLSPHSIVPESNSTSISDEVSSPKTNVANCATPSSPDLKRADQGVDVASEREVESRAVGGARRCRRCFVTGLDKLAKHVFGFEGVAQF